MSDLLQNTAPADPAYGDLVLTSGQLTLVDGNQEVQQLLIQQLRTFMGGYFLDPTLGVPYVQQVFQKGISQDVMEGIFRQAILDVPGVLSITAFQLTLTARNLTLLFTALTTNGPVTVPLVV